MISILLASYNGAKYLSEQIDSIMSQSEQRFVLYINDDASSDETWELLQSYASRYPDRIVITRNTQNSGSSKENFLQMMISHQDDYLMLCDQDDVWMPDKIKKTLASMQKLEASYGKDTPLLVYTDLRVVDEQLTPIADSMMYRVNADFTKTSLRNELCQNTLTGCTVMYNRALAEMIRSKPAFFVMHDWWLMLLAAAFGKIAYLPEATILYRQHGDNSVGTRDMRSNLFIARFMMNGKQIHKALDETYLQAEALAQMYGDQMSDQDKALVSDYAGIRKCRKPGRICRIVRLGTWKQGTVRRIGQLLYC